MGWWLVTVLNLRRNERVSLDDVGGRARARLQHHQHRPFRSLVVASLVLAFVVTVWWAD